MKLNIDKNQIKYICEKENINYLGLFGSCARGEEDKESDVDVLVNFRDVKSFFQLGKIQEEFEQIFNKKVDLILENNIKEGLKKYILKDLINIYEKR